MSRKEIRALLGNPNDINKFLPIDRWSYKGYQLSLQFSDDDQMSKIDTVTLHLPRL